MSGRGSALHDRHSSFVQVVGSSLDPRIALTALQYFDQRCAQVTEVAKGACTSRNSVRGVPNRRELIFDAVGHQLVVQGSSLECEVEVAPSAPPDCITCVIKMRPHLHGYEPPDVEPPPGGSQTFLVREPRLSRAQQAGFSLARVAKLKSRRAHHQTASPV